MAAALAASDGVQESLIGGRELKNESERWGLLRVIVTNFSSLEKTVKETNICKLDDHLLVELKFKNIFVAEYFVEQARKFVQDHHCLFKFLSVSLTILFKVLRSSCSTSTSEC